MTLKAVTSSSIRWFCISRYLAKTRSPCWVIPWEVHMAKNKSSLALKYVLFSPLSLELFWKIQLGSKCMLPIVGPRHFFFQVKKLAKAYTPQAYQWIALTRAHSPYDVVMSDNHFGCCFNNTCLLLESLPCFTQQPGTGNHASIAGVHSPSSPSSSYFNDH